MTVDRPPLPPCASRMTLPDWLEGGFWRVAASGWLPAHWVESRVPDETERAAKTGRLHVELVSHCWNYAHLLAYQLCSLVRFPPERMTVTMTVYHAEEDAATVRLLSEIGAIDVPNVTWNWRSIPKTHLFRRSIGRNEAALATEADWVWFTDCDLMFRDGCLDALADALQERTDILLYPDAEFRTSLLEDGDPLLTPAELDPGALDIDESRFHKSQNTRATGPFQITHGDVARACGYCDAIGFYQKPQPTFAKCREDRAFRWLLGSQGTPIAVPEVYRIRHASKGRYSGSNVESQIRKWFRRDGGPAA